ncbi:MAG: caspase family protein [Deltaproteobacteria bacterium]|nr:caspase family protein [Deltaproteobacteria bacterium]
MIRRGFVFPASVALLLFALAAHAEEQAAAVRRFALVVGVNDGGATRTPLRFATSDAETFARVMEDLGGVASEDLVLLNGPDRRGLLDGITELARKVAQAKSPQRRLEALFYYSGHSDENGLLVAGELIGYQELRAAMQTMAADVRIAVVDSCASGALTRVKGGKKRPSFLVDAATQLKGHAFLTSSSATEAAQESDRIGASFFTHFLVSGLRGAADMSGDGRVTLTEAYQFAFNETLAKTESSRAGAQHPNYDIELSGAGDLVMTDLRATSASLVLDETLAGRFYIRDAEGRLVVELYKLQDRAVELGLSVGDYQVTVDDSGVLSRAQVSIAQGDKLALSEVAFVHLDGEAATVRGDVDRGAAAADAEVPTFTEPAAKPGVRKARKSVAPAYDPAGYDVQAVSFELLPGLSGRSDRKVVKHFSLGLLGGSTDRLHGIAVSPGVNVTTEAVRGVEIAGGANIDRGTFEGLQVAGGVSIATGGGRGVQVAGGVGISGASLLGAQVAGGANFSGGELLRGIQVAGGVNLAGARVRGVQVAGGANVAGGQSDGAQISGGVNVARALSGVQVAVLNISGDVTGAQIGVVNIAGGAVRGAQIGVVNVAKEYTRGVPLGLFNVVKNARYHAEVWASELTPLNVGLRLDVTEHTYTLIAVGYAPGRDDAFVPALGRGRGPGLARAQAGFGLGTKVGLGEGLALRFDGLASESFAGDETGRHYDTQNDLVVQLRAGASFALFDHLGVFAGVGLSSYMSWSAARDSTRFAGELPSRLVTHGSYTARYWPGLFGGVQF